MKKSITLYEPVSIILGILLVASITSDKIKDFQDRKELKKQIDTSVTLSGEVVTLSANVMQLSTNLNGMIKEKGEVEKKYERQLAEKDAKTGEQFGILTAQAKSIAETTPSADTTKHFDTAKTFMNLYGGTITDVGLAWNTSYVNSSVKDYEAIKKELEITRNLNQQLQKNLEKTSNDNVTLSTQLNGKSIELEKTVGKVSLIENTLYAQKGWMAKFKQIIFYSVIIAMIGALGYVAFHLWHIKKKNADINEIREKLREEAERRRLANKEKFEKDAEAKELASAVKTFLKISPDGNRDMLAILGANGLRDKFKDFVDCNGNGIDDRGENKENSIDEK